MIIDKIKRLGYIRSTHWFNSVYCSTMWLIDTVKCLVKFSVIHVLWGDHCFPKSTVGNCGCFEHWLTSADTITKMGWQQKSNILHLNYIPQRQKHNTHIHILDTQVREFVCTVDTLEHCLMGKWGAHSASAKDTKDVCIFQCMCICLCVSWWI